MKLTIRHHVVYRFQSPVFVEPHIVRMRPRTDIRQRLVSHTLSISPSPTGQSEYLDYTGGSSSLAWFDDLTTELAFEARSEVETIPANPFDYIVPDRAMSRLPVAFGKSERVELAPVLALTPAGPGVTSLIVGGRNAVDDDTLQYPVWLAAEISRRVTHEERLEPGLLDLDQMLTDGKGSCRDMAALFVTACRSVGLPARFVSGYHFAETESGQNELHGWAEVYMPGGGWRAFDPSLGVACTGDHVALTAAADIGLTALVSGSVRGDDPGVMSYDVSVKAVPA